MEQASFTELIHRRRDHLSKAGERRLRINLMITCGALLTLLVGGFIVITVQLYGHAAAAALWAMACLAVGSIAGFLFAIPRVPRSSLSSRPNKDRNASSATSETESEERAHGLGINTNLEEISDWLTKILVGLGLIELRSLPDNVRRLGEYIGRGLGPDQQTAASGLVIYFFMLGFLCGYLLTRMFLSPAFQLADKATTIGLDEDRLEEVRALAVETASQVGEINSDLDTAMAELKLKKEERPPARMDQLLATLEKHRRTTPLHRKLNIVLARVYWEGKQNLDKSIGVLDEYIKAKTLADQSNDRDTADAFFNMACYYSLKMEGKTGEIRNQLEALGIKAVENSLAILPENANDVLVDKDLAELRKSTRLQELVRTAIDKLPKPNM